MQKKNGVVENHVHAFSGYIQCQYHQAANDVSNYHGYLFEKLGTRKFQSNSSLKTNCQECP